MKTVINVGGVSRSGSTMLHLILGNDESAFACGEIVNRFRPVKTHHRPFECACRVYPCPVWQRLDSTNERTFYREAFNILGVDLITDSSKEASWLLDARRWAERDDLTTINVFVYKDPIDLAYSFWKRGHNLMRWRSELVLYYGRVLGVGLPLLTINLGELLENPAGKVEQTCRVIGIPYAPGKERFWEKSHHHAFGNLGVQRQVQSGRSVFQRDRTYPADFAQHIDELRGRIASDLELQWLLQHLADAEVKNHPEAAGRGQQFDRPRPYPTWYYRQRLRRLWYGRFPRTDDAAVSEAAATVPGRSDAGD